VSTTFIASSFSNYCLHVREDCKNLTRDCIGPVYCGYGQWSDGVLAYTKALHEGRTQVLPVVLMESDS
jgi:hypothetical protein